MDLVTNIHVMYQIHFSNLSHNATWEITTCMLVTKSISRFSHNATWGNHHMYVGYQIQFQNFLIMQPGKIITCLLATKPISRIVSSCNFGNHHMYVGNQPTCDDFPECIKSISLSCLIMQSGKLIASMLVSKPFLEFVS